ncbi:MAG: dockerin type I repeat-containing protein [Clostridia bacterium]|nr:dockerin type I repeat-containing protein [Clostridia bacterium]
MNESGRSDVHYYLGATQELSIDLLLDYLDDVIKSRFYYRDRGWQEVMRSVGEDMGEAGDFDVATLLRLLVPDAWYALNALFEEWDYLSFSEKVSELRDLLAALTNYKTLLTDNPAGSAVGMLISIIAHYAVRFHLTEASFGSLSLTDNYEHLFALLGDTFRNKMSGELFMQHWPETYMAWLDSASDESLFERSSYTRVSLKCPIDVYVYDSNEVLVGRIVDDVVDESLEESVYCACDMLGEKTVYLPDDDTYRIEIVAREDCEIDLVNEYYTDQMELASVECYLDVPMDEEQSFEADYQKEELECTLTSDGTEIEADYTVGEEEEVPEFTVELTCEGFGTIAGDGYYTLGETVSLCALELYGSTFVGWYDENGVLISTEIEYSYSITENGAFTAVFEGGRMPGDADGNGVIDTTDALYVLRCALGIDGDANAMMAVCDMDGSGTIDTTDALLILRMALGIE